MFIQAGNSSACSATLQDMFEWTSHSAEDASLQATTSDNCCTHVIKGQHAADVQCQTDRIATVSVQCQTEESFKVTKLQTNAGIADSITLITTDMECQTDDVTMYSYMYHQHVDAEHCKQVETNSNCDESITNECRLEQLNNMCDTCTSTEIKQQMKVAIDMDHLYTRSIMMTSLTDCRSSEYDTNANCSDELLEQPVLTSIPLKHVHLPDGTRSTDITFSLTYDDNSKIDQTYVADTSEDSSTLNEITNNEDNTLTSSPVDENKYIVFHRCLMELIEQILCSKCQSPCDYVKNVMIGTGLHVITLCIQGHQIISWYIVSR